MVPLSAAEIEAVTRRTLFEMICNADLPADYRRDLLRQELSTLDNATANDFLDRVLGRLGHDDPLVVLMMEKA